MIKLPQPQIGLPCKSYSYIMDIDRELYNFLSYISDSPYFDYYISSLIRRYYRQKERKLATENFLKFSVIYNEERLKYIYPSKILDRIGCIKFLSKMKESATFYLKIKKKIKSGKEPTKDEAIFFSLFKNRWLVKGKRICDQIQYSYTNVHNMINLLFKSHKKFIVKHLLKNRKGLNKPIDYLSSAYEILLIGINVYNYQRSMVPLFKLIQPYVYNYKNNLVTQDTTWDLKGTLVRLDAIEDAKSNTLFINNAIDKQNSIDYNNDDKVIPAIKDSIWKSIENSMYHEKRQDDRLRLIEMAFQSLPTPLKQIISIQFNLIDPLPIEQEIFLALS